MLGYIDNEILAKIDRENWSTTHVADVFNQADDSNSVAPTLSASELMNRIVETKRRKFLVTDGAVLLGVISLSDLTSYLALLQDLRGAQFLYANGGHEMSNILVVKGHPDGSAPHLCHALGQTYAEAAEAAGHTVETIDLGQIEIAPLRSKVEWESTDIPEFAADGQAAITRADHIVFIYPLWLGTMPALLKAWLEHVFREGFALKVTANGWESFLKGKSARVVVTMGMPGMAYRLFFLCPFAAQL